MYSPGQGKATIRAVDAPVRGADRRFHLGEREEGLPPDRLPSLDRMGKKVVCRHAIVQRAIPVRIEFSDDRVERLATARL
jgi:hypothetical protein